VSDVCVTVYFSVIFSSLFEGTKEEAALVSGESDITGWVSVSCSAGEESWQLFAGKY